MTDKKEQTKAGATELTEEELGEAKGGVTIANNFEEVRRDKKAGKGLVSHEEMEGI